APISSALAHAARSAYSTPDEPATNQPSRARKRQSCSPACNWLKSLNAAIAHYKVCSTFDSAPHVGNIGKAVEIGKAIFNQA
ncbi:four-carbon acid sugar kinase family protein, partial [Brucella anthropi]